MSATVTPIFPGADTFTPVPRKRAPKVAPHDGAPTREAIVAGSFVPVKDAAARLGLKVGAVYALMRARKLVYLRAAGRDRKAMRVSVVSLDYFIAQNLIAH